MTREEIIEYYGEGVDSLCSSLCSSCQANDWYCPSDCDTILYVRHNYDKVINKLAELDNDDYEFRKRVRHWKGFGTYK